MQTLTRAEEEIMHKLWELKKAYVKEVLETLPSPKPAYNTVSTIIRILEKKGVVGHEKTGKSYLYYPILKKDEYKKQSLKKLISGYFEGSFANMASFFAKEENLSKEELDEVLQHIKEQK
ncbi:BlaI/MecI/CopY family transcriptional regulator [Marivirga arenosa]|uniref:BlaI/MecI/CopY family transcriptional regulator n=1 Tax=Marivirga arenosa TaxID=3059076 RepID=A0AA51ZY07_9BACT|nr:MULTISPECIES: BlaI/MecI/CopY family transcriptional regulator [unclassified Marivirga]WMN07029.1 BlaI/MecI/CopY family transcriptional regulator [Marivirga sp. ABR2-2]WNB18790.1 BlaI/MecI/CopY family transcriptional regulator [Marivirga sp. BKB1-2]